MRTTRSAYIDAGYPASAAYEVSPSSVIWVVDVVALPDNPRLPQTLIACTAAAVVDESDEEADEETVHDGQIPCSTAEDEA